MSCCQCFWKNWEARFLHWRKQVYKEQTLKVFLVPLQCWKKLSVNSMRWRCESLRPLFPAVVWSRSTTMSLAMTTAMQTFLVNKLHSSISKNRKEWNNWQALYIHCTISAEYWAGKKYSILRKYADKVSVISTQISPQIYQSNFGFSRPHNKGAISQSILHTGLLQMIQPLEILRFI